MVLLPELKWTSRDRGDLGLRLMPRRKTHVNHLWKISGLKMSASSFLVDPTNQVKPYLTLTSLLLEQNLCTVSPKRLCSILFRDSIITRTGKISRSYFRMLLFLVKENTRFSILSGRRERKRILIQTRVTAYMEPTQISSCLVWVLMKHISTSWGNRHHNVKKTRERAQNHGTSRIPHKLRPRKLDRLSM